MKRLFHGWYVALACGIGLACGLATVLTYTFGVFVTPLRAEFAWSQTEVFAALFLSVLTITFVAPFFGLLVDRLGARRVILVGLVLEAALVASFYFQDANVLTFYLRYIALAVFGVGTTHIAFTRIIALWFDRQRGLALGVTLAGVGIGGFAWPILTQWAIDAFGWRSAWLVVAAAIILVGGTSVLLVVRDSPQSMGLQPDGDTAAGSRDRAVKHGAPPSLTLKQALATRHFWTMLVVFLLIGVAVTSIQVHLVPLLVSRGVTPMRAANALSILAVALLFGRVAAGWLMDRIFAPRVAIAFLLGPIVAIFLLANGASGWLAFLAGILTGLAAGAEVDVTAYLVSRYFGLQHFSSIYAWYYSAYSLGAGLGPLATANAVDRLGGYTEILFAHAAMLAVATILLALLPAFPANRPAAP
ncbi:MAG: MFS transporter [Gammaproteobacteria bacterium]